MDLQSIKLLFEKNNGYLTRSQLPGRDTYEVIRKLIDSGKVERVKNGLYYMEGTSRFSELTNLENIVTDGVLCLYSAWFYYDLTVQIPQSIHVAIERSRKVTLPEYPSIELYYWSKKFLDLGVTQVKVDRVNVRIYDIHKSVCDAVKFRKKIGTETFAEILKTYLKRKDRNLVKLFEYARVMRVEKIVKTYIEVQS